MTIRYMKMEKFSAMIPTSLRLDLEYLATKYDTNLSTMVRAFLQRCVDEALDKEEASNG